MCSCSIVIKNRWRGIWKTLTSIYNAIISNSNTFWKFVELKEVFADHFDDSSDELFRRNIREMEVENKIIMKTSATTTWL